MNKITNQDFAAAKKAAKKVVADQSAAHKAAAEVLKNRCPQANEQLIWDMAWQCFMAARG